MRWFDWQAAVGEIAFVEGRTSDAIAAFNRASHSDSGRVEPDWSGRQDLRLARTYDKAGQADSAIRYFERLTTPQALVGSTVFASPAAPLAPRRLGELYEAKGDIMNALKNYEDFVRIWKNADPELQPQVTDIKARIVRLRAAEAKKR